MSCSMRYAEMDGWKRPAAQAIRCVCVAQFCGSCRKDPSIDLDCADIRQPYGEEAVCKT